MKNRIAILMFVATLSTVSCHHRIQSNPSPALSEGALIENVVIRGNRNIPSDTVAPQIHTKIGDHIVAAVVKDDIRRLYSLGFAAVAVTETLGRNGGRVVIFDVREEQ